MPNDDLEEYKKKVGKKISELLPIFAKAAVGDFSANIDVPEEEDEFTPLYVGLQLVLEVIREKISELKHLNVELSAKGEKNEFERIRDEAILESIGEGLFATDETGKVLLLNKAGELLFEITSEEIVGKDVTTFIGMEDENGHTVTKENRPMTLALSTGKKVSGIFYYIRPNATKFPVGLTVSPILLNDKVIGSVEVFRDVTAERELERLKDEFVSMSSHELRTPMTAIKGFISMIFRGDFGPVNEGLKTPLHTVANSTERLISLVNNLLDVSRIESRRISYELVDFAITDVIEQVVETIYPISLQKGVKITIPQHQDILVQADPDKVKQILHNIIGNALKFTENGEITVSLKEYPEEVYVLVHDSGNGISLEGQQKLFQKFQQISTSQRGRPEGTGLGLYISSELAKKMGGKLWLVDSQPRKGSTFALALPLSSTKLAETVKVTLNREGVLTEPSLERKD